jgi:hypothetical protein
MEKEVMIEKLKKDAFLSFLVNEENKYKFTLTGGAIIDILEDRSVKDYDFVSLDNNFLSLCKFEYETSFSISYSYKSFKIQLLKTSVSDFDFRISQSLFQKHYNGDTTITIDNVSFMNKTLIPCNFENPIEKLKRLVHWKRKGYNIHDITFTNLITILNKDLNKES